jgi:xylulokinase
VGAGEFASVPQACGAIIEVTRSIKPNAKAKAAYQRYYQQYAKLYPALKAEFAAISGL